MLIGGNGPYETSFEIAGSDDLGQAAAAQISPCNRLLMG